MMKIWFEWTYPYQENCKIGIDWYKHSDSFIYRGFTINIILVNRLLCINWVNSGRLYKEHIERYEAKRNKWRKKLGFKTNG